MSFNDNGVVVWSGPSQIDGSPIVLIATGLKASSLNSKTGGMVQTWILPADQVPTEAVRAGKDVGICGGCPHRGRWDEEAGKMVERSCYVNVGQAPNNIYRTMGRDRYEVLTPTVASKRVVGRKTRAGAYGDPAAVPFEVWVKFLTYVEEMTGYTHQWRKFPAFKAFCMASVDSEAEALEAQAAGWRTFRVKAKDDAGIKGEVVCPASEAKGKVTTCDKCMACGGLSSKAKASIVIDSHGSGAGHADRR